MKSTKSSIIMMFFSLFFTRNIFCFSPAATCDLLLGYIENDSSVKENALSVQKAQLSLESAKINNNFDITLSTGNITFKFDDESSFSIKPAVELKKFLKFRIWLFRHLQIWLRKNQADSQIFLQAILS